jgi:hypothetical protein
MSEPKSQSQNTHESYTNFFLADMQHTFFTQNLAEKKMNKTKKGQKWQSRVNSCPTKSCMVVFFFIFAFCGFSSFDLSKLQAMYLSSSYILKA